MISSRRNRREFVDNSVDLMKKTLKKNIFLIDDDEVTNLINVRLIKRHYDTNIATYTSAAESLDDLRSWISSSPGDLPDVIFLDLHMPLMDGWAFLAEFETLPSALKDKCGIIMLSATVETSDLEKSRAYPSVKRFVIKPLTKDKLTFLEVA